MELLVPPRRLGRLLAQARVARGFSLEDVREELDDRMTEVEVAGDRDRSPAGHRSGAADPGRPVRRRDVDHGSRTSDLTVDLDDGLIEAGSNTIEVHDAAERREVLSKYLALVYSMRGQEPGTTVTLRLGDLDVLAETFGTERRTIEDELVDLMVATPEPVTKRFRLLRGRLMVPVIGRAGGGDGRWHARAGAER